MTCSVRGSGGRLSGIGGRDTRTEINGSFDVPHSRIHLKLRRRQVLMVAADVYRPAAIDQLRTLGACVFVCSCFSRVV